MDRLTIAQVQERLAYTSPLNDSYYKTLQQLLDTMRENERLKAEVSELEFSTESVYLPPEERLKLHREYNKRLREIIDALPSKHSETEPSPFMGVSSAELFKTLGASPDEAEKMQRGLEAVVRREDMKHPSKT